MKTLLFSTAMVVVLATPSFAQTLSETAKTATDEATASAKTSTDVATDAATSAVPGASGQAMTDGMLALNGVEISAESLIDHRVHSPEEGTEATAQMRAGVSEVPDSWEDIGEIGDVLIDASGNVDSVVVDAGGFLGIGERHVRVALTELAIIKDTDDEGEYFVVYTGGRAMLEGAEPYDTGSADLGGVMSIRDKDTPTIAPGAERDTAMATEPRETNDGLMGAMDRPNRDELMAVEVTTVTADDLEGASVYDEVDGWVGDISELVLNDDGKVSHIVVDVGGLLGIGEHSVALGFDQIDLRRQGENGSVYAFVDYTEAELEAMPEWNG